MLVMSTARALLFGLLVAMAFSADADMYKAKLRSNNRFLFTSNPGAGDKVASKGVVNMELMDDGMFHGIVSIKKIVAQLTANIHDGADRTAGPVVFTSFPDGSPALTGTFSYPIVFNASILDEETLNAGGYYYSVQTAAFPLGEIRGQFLRC